MKGYILYPLATNMSDELFCIQVALFNNRKFSGSQLPALPMICETVLARKRGLKQREGRLTQYCIAERAL